MKLYTDEGNLDWVFNNTVILLVDEIRSGGIANVLVIARLFHSRSAQVSVAESVS